MLKKYFTTEIKIFLISILFLLMFIKPSIEFGIECSRMATIESLVEEKTFIIDNSSFTNNCIDKIYIDCNRYPNLNGCGHFYSEKPPFLSFLGAGIYLILNSLLGLDISSSWHVPYLLVFLLIAIPYTLLLILFYRSLALIKVKEKYKVLLTLGLGFGTILLPYATILNNHIPATVLLFASFYLFLKLKFSKKINVKSNLCLIGLLTGFASIIDYTSAIFIILFLGYNLLTKKIRNNLIYFILGLILPLSIHLILNYSVFETIKPAYFMQGVYDYPNSYWKGYAASHSQGNLITDSYHLLLGDAGLFTFSPVLIIPFIYLLFSLFSNKHELRKEAWMVLLGVVIIYLTYILVFHSSYKDLSFGFRFGMLLIPLIMFFGACFFKEKVYKERLLIFYATLFFSIAISFIGVLHARGLVQNHSLIIGDIFPLMFFIAFALIYKPKS